MIKSVRELDLRGKCVFLRLDLNVPLDGDKITDDNRIVQALPTLQYILEQNAKVVVASHLGRPKGERKAEFSLVPVAARLAEALNADVTLAEDCVGEGVSLMLKSLGPGKVMVLENLRFHKGETGNDSEFVQKLSKGIDVYVTDAFGTSHRKHASTYGLAEIIPEKGMGFLIEKELKFLDQILKEPPKPFYTILGGAKVSDKIKTIEALMPRVQGFCIGGAMAFAFEMAKGRHIPDNAKQPSPEDVKAAKSILKDAERMERPILLPVDLVDAFDIGPKTVEQFGSFLKDAKCVFWNGPLGWFEKPDYAKGTFDIAKVLADMDAVKIVGGGDTVSAIKQSGLAESFDHLSTGGGAVLEYLEGKGLPGIDILQSRKVESYGSE